MKSRVLIIKMDLLPWYDELDDYLDVNHLAFPVHVRKRIKLFGKYTILSISRYETRLRRISSS